MIGKTRIDARPATEADVRAFFGSVPRTIRAQVIELDGEVAAIGGYYIAGGQCVVFSDIRKPIPKAAIWRIAKRYMERLNLPAICVADENSGPFLERLGWVYAGPSDVGDLYRWQY